MKLQRRSLLLRLRKRINVHEVHTSGYNNADNGAFQDDCCRGGLLGTLIGTNELAAFGL